MLWNGMESKAMMTTATTIDYSRDVNNKEQKVDEDSKVWVVVGGWRACLRGGQTFHDPRMRDPCS